MVPGLARCSSTVLGRSYNSSKLEVDRNRAVSSHLYLMLLELIIFVHLRSFFLVFIKGRFSILHPEKKETEHD